MASQGESPRLSEPAAPGSARDFVRRQGEMLAAGFSFSGFERDLVALNLGDGRFLDISGVSGADSVGDGRAAVYADLDNDGDADIFLRSMYGRAHLLFRNEVGHEAGFLRITLEGRDSGRDAFGAVVRVHLPGRTLTRMKSGGAGFVSQGDPRLLFGLGSAQAAEGIEVRWPSGRTQRFPGAPAGASLLLVEGEERARPVAERRFSLPAPLSSAGRLWRQLNVAAGDAVPDLPVTDLQGRTLSLASLVPAGRPAVINFWATWCVPCRREMPELEALHAGGGLTVIGVSLDRPGDRGRIPAFLEGLAITYPVVHLPEERREALFAGDSVPIPLSLLVGRDGRLMGVVAGWSAATRRELGRLAGGS